MERLKTFNSLKELESATGERFEIYAQYMLSLIHTGYIGTRIHKDNGIDGILLSRESRDVEPVIYSIYGPERGTNWTSKLRKIKDDIESIKEYVDRKFAKYTVCFVFNFKLAGDEISELDNYCSDEGITYSFLYPEKLFIELEDNTKLITNAVAFLDGIEVEAEDITDLNNHIFAGKVLEILCQINEGDDTVDKLEKIMILKYKLLSYLPLEALKLKQWSKNRIFAVTNRNEFKEKTTVNQGYKTVYIFENKTGKIKKFNEESYENTFGNKLEYIPTISISGNGLYAIKIEDLEVIFFLLNNCYLQLQNKGSFNLTYALHTAMRTEERIEKWRLIRKAKLG